MTPGHTGRPAMDPDDVNTGVELSLLREPSQLFSGRGRYTIRPRPESRNYMLPPASGDTLPASMCWSPATYTSHPNMAKWVWFGAIRAE